MSTEFATFAAAVLSMLTGLFSIWLSNRLSKTKNDVTAASELSNSAMELVDRLEKRLDNQEKVIEAQGLIIANQGRRIAELESDNAAKDLRINAQGEQIRHLEQQNEALSIDNERLKREMKNLLEGKD